MSASLETELRAFNAAFSTYREFNKRAPGQLIEVRGRRIRFALWKAFRAIAPTPTKLKAEAAARGYRLKRRPDPSYVGPMQPGRSAPRVSIEKEIRLRTRSLKFLSASFLIREWKLRREGQNSRFAARSRTQARLGEAIVQTSPTFADPMVTLTSFLRGVVKQDRKRAIAAGVLRAETADIATYLARKHQESLTATFERHYQAVVSLT